jgi:hypothetical protein
MFVQPSDPYSPSCWYNWSYINNCFSHFEKIQFNHFGGVYIRGAKYSPELRQRILEAIQEMAIQGFPQGWNIEISQRFQVSQSYVSKLKQKFLAMTDQPFSPTNSVDLFYGLRQGLDLIVCFYISI